jgi:hypothetical protein
MANEDVIWIAGDASTFTLQSTGSVDRWLRGIEGMGLPTLVHQAELFPFTHGILDLARRFRERRVSLSYRQTFATRAAWYTGRQALAAAFNPDLGKGQLKVVDASGVDWRLDAWVVTLPEDEAAAWSPRELRVNVELWAPFPFWRKATATSSTGTFVGTGIVDVGITNGGSVASIPNTITITGQATNPLLTILTTNKKVDLRHTIAAGQTAVLTCSPPNACAALKGATNIIGDLTYDSTLAGFELPRGASTVRLVGGNALDNGVVTLSWYEWYLAV